MCNIQISKKDMHVIQEIRAKKIYSSLVFVTIFGRTSFTNYHWDGYYRCLHWLRNKCFTHEFSTNDKGWYFFVMYNIKSSQKMYCGRSNLVLGLCLPNVFFGKNDNFPILYNFFFIDNFHLCLYLGRSLPFYYKWCEKKKTYWNLLLFFISNVNRVLIFHFENILRMYLKYVRNRPLFHSILKNILLPQVFPKIYKDLFPYMFIAKIVPTSYTSWDVY